jgi:serine phosphatase RsbU (regulator of sigma subunit)
MLQERGIEHAAGSQAWLRGTLEEIVSQVRRLLDVTGVSFLVVDRVHSHIRPAASWFASDAVREAFVPVLDRPYEPERGGVTEAAIEGGAPVLIERITDWPGAEGLEDRLRDTLAPEAAQALWDWYSSSSFLSVPVRTGEGRILGVLALARSLPHPAFDAEELRAARVLADLAALALERSELLDREERRARDEEALNRASQEVARSLDLDEVADTICSLGLSLTGAATLTLARMDRGGATLREVARCGLGEPDGERHRLGSGDVGRAAQSGSPVLGDGLVHVPLVIGPRVFGVISALAGSGGFAEGGIKRLTAFAPAAAAALANALDYERERRVVHAMTASFVPQRPPALADYEVGLVYEPAGQQASGGDVFGVWTLPSGGLGLVIGDVSGSGLEVAATASMVRFFVEARTFDCPRPAEVLAQTNAILRGRLPDTVFVPLFLAVIDDHRLRWCNAGHPPPQLLRAGGGEAELGTTGIPLGIDEHATYDERACALEPGDVLVAATDGLWEARRDGVQFGDARLKPLLAEHGRALDPEALTALLRDEAERWCPQRHDDLVILAVRARR